MRNSETNDKKGKMTLEEIADYVPSLSFDELRDFEAEGMYDRVQKFWQRSMAYGIDSCCGG